MQPVLRLLEDHRARHVGDLVGHLLAAVGRQAVHEDRVGTRPLHDLHRDLVRHEDLLAILALGLLPHRGPDVRVDRVGTLDGAEVLTDVDRSPGLLGGHTRGGNYVI